MMKICANLAFFTLCWLNKKSVCLDYSTYQFTIMYYSKILNGNCNVSFCPNGSGSVSLYNLNFLSMEMEHPSELIFLVMRTDNCLNIISLQNRLNANEHS
jgi:hypothetical protein